jgi:hypothetical protein
VQRNIKHQTANSKCVSHQMKKQDETAGLVKQQGATTADETADEIVKATLSWVSLQKQASQSH